MVIVVAKDTMLLCASSLQSAMFLCESRYKNLLIIDTFGAIESWGRQRWRGAAFDRTHDAIMVDDPKCLPSGNLT